jgi:hypothetical protein
MNRTTLYQGTWRQCSRNKNRRNSYRPGSSPVTMKWRLPMQGHKELHDPSVGPLPWPARLLVVGMLIGTGFLVVQPKLPLPSIIENTFEKCRELINGWMENTSIPKPVPPPVSASKPASVDASVNGEAFKPLVLLVDQVVFKLGPQGQIAELTEAPGSLDAIMVTGVTVHEIPSRKGIRLAADCDLEVIRTVLHAPWASQISEVYFTPEAELAIYTRNGEKCYFRLSATLADDLVRAFAVLLECRKRHIPFSIMDVRYPQHVVVRPRTRR